MYFVLEAILSHLHWLLWIFICLCRYLGSVGQLYLQEYGAFSGLQGTRLPAKPLEYDFICELLDLYKTKPPLAAAKLQWLCRYNMYLRKRLVGYFVVVLLYSAYFEFSVFPLFDKDGCISFCFFRVFLLFLSLTSRSWVIKIWTTEILSLLLSSLKWCFITAEDKLITGLNLISGSQLNGCVELRNHTWNVFWCKW